MAKKVPATTVAGAGVKRV